MPTYDLGVLMAVMQAETAAELATMVGVSVNVVHNLLRRGITWIRADDFAVRCGYHPIEIWPEWGLADPADWMGPSCPNDHGYDHLVETEGGGERCSLCPPATAMAA